MPKPRNNSPAGYGTGYRESESGNIFVMIMVGVMLFAALMFTFSRGAQQGTGNISDKQATLAATDIIAHSQKIARAVDRIYRQGYSESDISFENAVVTGYANANCADNECRIFHPAGGAVSWQAPPPEANDGSPWLFAGNTQVLGIAKTNNDAASSELIAFLPGLDQAVCAKINDRLELGFSSVPVDNGDLIRTKYTGSFLYENDLTGTAGTDMVCPPALFCNIRTACFQEETGSQKYIFYSVLLER